MNTIGVALAVIGALVILEAAGVSVMGSLVSALGGQIEDGLGALFWGTLDFFNPANYI